MKIVTKIRCDQEEVSSYEKKIRVMRWSVRAERLRCEPWIHTHTKKSQLGVRLPTALQVLQVHL